MTTNPLCPNLYERINGSLYFQEGNYLEIGAFNGAGAASVARKYPDKRIYVIDEYNNPLMNKMFIDNNFCNDYTMNLSSYQTKIIGLS